MRTKVIGDGEYVNAVFTRLEWEALRIALFHRDEALSSVEGAAMTRVLTAILRTIVPEQ